MALTPRYGVPLAAGVLATLATGNAVPEDRAAATMAVSASVLPRTTVNVDTPATLSISPADQARGRLRLPQAVRVRISSNSGIGVLLHFAAPAGMFSGIEVRGAGLDEHLPGDGGSINLPNATPHRAMQLTLDLQLSFELAAGVASGEYDWPLVLQAQAR